MLKTIEQPCRPTALHQDWDDDHQAWDAETTLEEPEVTLELKDSPSE